MYPVCLKYCFCSAFFPVTFTLDALMTMTLSPVSMWGVYIGLCLPRMIFATSTASLPSTIPSASTTYQRWVMSLGVALYVFMWSILTCVKPHPASDGEGGGVFGSWFGFQAACKLKSG